MEENNYTLPPADIKNLRGTKARVTADHHPISSSPLTVATTTYSYHIEQNNKRVSYQINNESYFHAFEDVLLL
jgi:hypothetical protein